MTTVQGRSCYGCTPITWVSLRFMALQGVIIDRATLANWVGTAAARLKPLVEAMHNWLEDKKRRMFSGSPTPAAINYALGHWAGLIRFLGDDRIDFDNNAVERSMRPIALQRKKALFAGHDLGAENWAAIASLIDCCNQNDINPNSYLPMCSPASRASAMVKRSMTCCRGNGPTPTVMVICSNILPTP